MKTRAINNIIVIICAVIMILIVAITAAASVISAGEKSKYRGYEEFSGGWLSEDGTEAQLDKLSESCVIHKQILVLYADEVLSFNARNVDVDVYIDDLCVYRTKSSENGFLKAIYGKTAGSEFVYVSVFREFSGRTLYIDIKNPYSNGSACSIVNMYFGDGVAIVKHDASIQLGAFCFSVIILFIGVVCMIVYIPMARHKLIDSSMLYLGMSAFAFGMVMITDSKMLHLVVGHETLYYTVSQMFMVILPIPLLMFFEKLYGTLNRKIIILLCAADIIDFIAVITLNIFGIIDYHDNAAPVLLIMAASIVYIGFITLKRLIKRDKDTLFHNIGVLMLAVAVILDMLMTRVDGFVETSFFMRFGLAGFTCMECIQVLWKHIENYQKGVKAQLVSRLAYHDGLTDMLNRTSFMEDMETLESRDDNKGVLIAVFDVNGLKYVNDTFGHTDGDELIVNTANALSDAFDGIGKCYRTGGDEFVFISDHSDAEKQFISACSVLNANLRDIGAHSRYPVSVAVGYSVMNESGNSLKELLKKADEKMYENKRRMKEKSVG